MLTAGMIAAAALPNWARAQPAVASPSLCDALAGNLVRNCGFEAGDFVNWSTLMPLGSAIEIAEIPTSAHTGSYVARFSGFATSSFTETLTTIPGARYTFTFYLVSLGIGAEPTSSSTFAAYFGRQQVFSLLGQGPLFDAGYARYSFTQTASGTSTEIRFAARNASAAYNLDDVSVTAAAAVVPEPATFALLGGGLLALGAAAGRDRVRGQRREARRRE